MTLHNYRLICPNGLFMVNEQICTKCQGGKEYFCIINNCENNFFKSFAYALRSYIARRMKYYLKSVDMFICLTKFQKKIFIQNHFPSQQLIIIPNFSILKKPQLEINQFNYVGFIGRLSPAKGFDSFVNASMQLPNIPFKAIGVKEKNISKKFQNSPNFEYQGFLTTDNELIQFISDCAFIIFPTLCFEGMPKVIIDVMTLGKPVICSKIGGLSEIVEHNKTGLLFETGNIYDLIDKIKFLWNNKALCMTMGMAGQEKATKLYSSTRCYHLLIQTYQNAIRNYPIQPYQNESQFYPFPRRMAWSVRNISS